MNTSKNLVAVTLVLFSQTFAMAAEWDCDEIKTILKCETTYELITSNPPGDMVAGPIAEAGIVNEEPEPFDPARCEASVVLYTYAGRFVATYYHRANVFTAWVDYNGKTSMLSDYQPIADDRAPMNTSMAAG